MKILRVILIGAALAGCGADGEPIRPAMSTTLTASSNGVGVGTKAGVNIGGGVSIGVGLGI